MDKRGKSLLIIGVILFSLLLFVSFVIAGTSEEQSILTEIVKNRTYIDELRTTDTIQLSNNKSGEDLAFKSYNSFTKEILIEDKEFKPIIKMKLISPYIVSGLIASSDTKVAEFYLEDWKNSKINLIDTINFYDIKNNYKPINKTFRFKYGTENENCELGHCFNYTTWTSFETLNDLPHKNIKISAWTKTEILESIEWIPTIEGFKILQWAEWNVTTASYRDVFKAVTTGNKRGLSFKSDGTKMYISISTGFVYQHPLSTPWNISSAGDVESTSPDLGTSQGLFISSDGTKLYNIRTPYVDQWTLSTPWNVSTATDDSVNEQVVGDPYGLTFNPDGSEMYTLDYSSKTIYQYTLSTPWDLSTSSYSGNSFSVSGEVTYPFGVFFKTDGTKTYVVSGESVNDIFQYPITTAWNVSTAGATEGSYDMSSQISFAHAVFFKPDGARFYVCDDSADKVFQYYLSEIVVDDTTPPNVTINQPLNNTYNTKTINFNVTALDETEMDSCWYSLNSGLNNFTMINSSTSPTYWTASNTSMAEGSHIVNFYCNDTSNNINDSEQVAFTIILDTTPPTTTQPIITPTSPTTTDNLECNAILTDDLQTDLTAYWKWYKNDVLNLSGTNTNIANGTLTTITTLDSGNTTKGENWICEVTPYDGYNYGTPQNSSSVTILNTPPNQSNPTLTTPNNKNLSTQDLTCTNKSTYDTDGDTVTNIYNWYKDNQPLTMLNLPFEINANDYSGNNNHGTRNGTSFVTGKVGQALSFDGIDDYVKVTKNFGTSFNAFSAEAWVNAKNIETQHRYILERDDIHFYISVTPDRKIRFRHIDLTNNEATETEANAIEFNEWTHIAVVYDGTKTYIYVNGELKKEQEDTGTISFSPSQPLYIGSSQYAHSYPDRTWNGTIDEVRVYNKALTQQQIQAHYNLEYNKIVSQETSGGDEWMCQVTTNDAEADGVTLNSSSLDVLWAIEFDIRDSYSNASINDVVINCNYTGFDQAGDTTNPYGPYGFPDGNWECTFTEIEIGYYNKTIRFNADNDKIVDILMSKEGYLTIEEHTWLEAIYNCLYSGDCSLYNLLLEVNQTVSNIWEHTAPTDESVVTFENITNKVVDSSNNLTIDYSVNIPVKAGYSVGAYLPVRIGFWFMDETNTTCYNQGDKPTGVEEPYCQPLIIETIGPMGGSVNFTVELQPSLPAGDYSIKRIIDIDPLGVWYNYGQETIGTFLVTETLTESGISLETTGESMPNSETESSSDSSSSSGGDSVTNVYNTYVTNENKKENELDEGEMINLNNPGITGGVIGTLLSGSSLVFVIAIIGGVLIVFIISRTILKVKKK